MSEHICNTQWWSTVEDYQAITNGFLNTPEDNLSYYVIKLSQNGTILILNI
jgi:hypothetical protein